MGVEELSKYSAVDADGNILTDVVRRNLRVYGEPAKLIIPRLCGEIDRLNSRIAELEYWYQFAGEQTARRGDKLRRIHAILEEL